MNWGAQAIAARLLWLATAVAAVSTILAGAIPIRAPHAIEGIGLPSYIVPGLVLIGLLAACAYGARRDARAAVWLSLLGTLAGLVVLVVVVLTLAYVCFQVSSADAIKRGCTGTVGATAIAGLSGESLLLCPVLCFLAFLFGVVAALRR